MKKLFKITALLISLAVGYVFLTSTKSLSPPPMSAAVPPIVSVAPAEAVSGTVVDIHDGDTLTLLIAGNRSLKVRLAGIDAPELDQPYGQQAQQALSRLTLHKEARIESAGPDKYGRTLGTVFVGSVNVNAALISQGAAWVYRKYPHPAQWEDLEDFAKNTNAGLWALPADQRIPPWEWRHPPAAAAVPVVPAAPVIMSAPSVVPRPIPSKPTATAAAGWTCEAKTTCKQMGSCDEAKFYLTTCGVKRLDGDGDGIPCEKLCKP